MTIADRFKLTDDTADLEIRKRYSGVLGSGAGAEVLAHMLEVLGFFEPVRQDQDIVLHNYAVHLLQMVGVIRCDADGRAANVAALTQQLLLERTG